MKLFLINNVMKIIIWIKCGYDGKKNWLKLCGLERMLVMKKKMCYDYYMK
jgi:hypothetical protein